MDYMGTVWSYFLRRITSKCTAALVFRLNHLKMLLWVCTCKFGFGVCLMRRFSCILISSLIMSCDSMFFSCDLVMRSSHVVITITIVQCTKPSHAWITYINSYIFWDLLVPPDNCRFKLWSTWRATVEPISDIKVLERFESIRSILHKNYNMKWRQYYKMYYFLIDLFTCYRLNIFIDSCALVQIFLVVLCFPLSMYFKGSAQNDNAVIYIYIYIYIYIICYFYIALL